MRPLAATLLLLVALVLGAFEFIALVDPIGTKMADDADPFGPPAPWHVHAIWLTFIALLIIFAIALLRRRNQDDVNRNA